MTEYIWGQTFFILLSLIPTTALLSTWIVAKFIWQPYKDKCEQDVLEPPPYEQRYPFLDDDVQDISGQNLQYVAVIEDTPQGLMILKYDEKTGIFYYWSEEDLQYRFLETAARRYVQGFACRHIYIDRIEELKKQWKRNIEINNEKKNRKAEKGTDNGLFAKLKVRGKETARSQKNMIVPKQANKYIKKGRLSECPFFKFEEKKTNKMCYADFKAFFKKDN